MSHWFNNFPDTEIWAEPGRFMCGTVSNLITSVIGTQTRNGNQWYFLDDGLYGTFSGLFLIIGILNWRLLKVVRKYQLLLRDQVVIPRYYVH